jgi:hypothetical protein
VRERKDAGYACPFCLYHQLEELRLSWGDTEVTIEHCEGCRSLVLDDGEKITLRQIHRAAAVVPKIVVVQRMPEPEHDLRPLAVGVILSSAITFGIGALAIMIGSRHLYLGDKGALPTALALASVASIGASFFYSDKDRRAWWWGFLAGALGLGLAMILMMQR